MKKNDVSRRDFGKLAFAAFGGAVAGSVLGGSLLSADQHKEAKGAGGDKHACCGLNACKGQGAGGDNDCAGQGKCSTTEAHGCQGANACKNQGGEGINDCKGQGSCMVPIKGDAWKAARKNYEAAMTKAGKKFGPAPASCGS